MHLPRMIIATVLVLSLGGASQAGMLASSTLRAKNQSFFFCSVTNISKKPREVTVEIVRGDSGERLAITGPLPINPSNRTQLTYFQGTYAVDDAWCRVAVKGGKKSVRGTFSVAHAADDAIVAVDLR